MSDTTPTGLPASSPRATSGGGCLRTLGWLGLIAGIVAIGGFAFVYWSIGNAYRAPRAYAAAVAWEPRTVTLSGDQPSVAGRFALVAKASQPSVSAGLTAGVPARLGGDTPGALLTAPSVRLTLTFAQGQTYTCLAPCELSSFQAFDCATGTCRLAGDLRVDLLGPAGDDPRPVTIDVAAGMSAPQGQGLPDGTTVELDIDGAATPGSS